jgi:hypothetical protein
MFFLGPFSPALRGRKIRFLRVFDVALYTVLKRHHVASNTLELPSGWGGLFLRKACISSHEGLPFGCIVQVGQMTG